MRRVTSRRATASVAVPPAALPGTATAGAPELARGALVLAAALVLLAALRTAAAFVPSMAVWSLNVVRFASAPWAATVLVLPALALVPALAAPAAAWLDRRRFEGLPARVACAIAAAVLVLVLPDRVWFTGDYIGRQFSLDAPGPALAWYAHSVPLDTAVHQLLGQLMVSRLGIPSSAYGRLLGAVEAGALAWIALDFARALAARGVAALAVASVVFFGGWLALFTGYNKALSEAVLVVAAFAMLGVRAVREGRGAFTLAVVFALGFLLHRSMLALTPAMLVAWWSWHRLGADGRSRGRASRWLPLAVPALALAAVGPQLARILRDFDLKLFLPPAGQSAASSGGGLRSLDLLNALVLLSPTALAVVPLAVVLGPALRRRPEASFLATLVVPMIALAVVFYPPEGLFRFWDIFAGPGVALSVATAWASTLVLSPSRSRWLGVALAMAVAAPSVAWLAHNTDTERGIERVRALLAESPARSPEVNANAREYLGFRLTDLGRHAEAAHEFERAAVVVPSPRVLRQWATAATLAGDLDGARLALRRLVERDPANPAGWRSLAMNAMRRGDSTEARRALEAVVRLAQSDTTARRLLDALPLRPRE